MKDVLRVGTTYVKNKGNSKNECSGISFFLENYPFIEVPEILFLKKKLLVTRRVQYTPYIQILETKIEEIKALESLFLKYISKARDFEQEKSIPPFIIKKDSQRRFGNVLDLFVDDIYHKLSKIKVNGYPLQGDASPENIGMTFEGKLAMIDFEHFSMNGQIPFELIGFYSPLFIQKIKDREEIHLDEKLLGKVSPLLTDEEFKLFVPYLLRDIGVFSFYRNINFKHDFNRKFRGLIRDLF